MSKFLKGSYKLKKAVGRKKRKKKEDIAEIFEHKALEKLGGSIAFVMKSDKFVWSEEDEKA